MDIVHEPGKISGVKIRIGSTEYIVPPLSMAGVEQHEEKLEKINMSNGSIVGLRDQTGIICEIVLSALHRNYPEMTMEMLKEILDLGNMQDVFYAVMGQSGFKIGEKAQAGETASV